MALQGTIDTFPLGDVLQLLASSSKTGRLVLEGDRGRVALWIEGGQVIGAEPSERAVGRAELVLFEMLRYAHGEFSFDADPTELGDVVPVEPAALSDSLAAAGELIAAWAAVEAVVPTPRHRVLIAVELPADSVTVGAEEWRVIAAAGSDVTTLAASLELDEFTATSSVADLVARGLLMIDEPAQPDQETEAHPEALHHDVPTVSGSAAGRREPDEPVGPHDLDDQAVGTDGAAPTFPERFPIDDLLGDGAQGDDPWSSPEMEQLEAQRMAAAQSFEAFELEPLPLLDPGEPVGTSVDTEVAPIERSGDPVDDGSDEVLRQMSRLSPKAAEAIAAALSSGAAASESTGPGDDRDSAAGDR